MSVDTTAIQVGDFIEFKNAGWKAYKEHMPRDGEIISHRKKHGPFKFEDYVFFQGTKTSVTGVTENRVILRDFGPVNPLDCKLAKPVEMSIAEKNPPTPPEKPKPDIIQSVYDCGRILEKLDNKDCWRVIYALKEIFEKDS